MLLIGLSITHLSRNGLIIPADSTNVARNIGIDKAWQKSAYAPASKETRAAVLVERIESMNSASALLWDADKDRFTPQLAFEL